MNYLFRLICFAAGLAFWTTPCILIAMAAVGWPVPWRWESEPTGVCVWAAITCGLAGLCCFGIAVSDD